MTLRRIEGGILGNLTDMDTSMTPFEAYPTADRAIVIGLGSAKDWPRFCEVIGLPDLAGDARFAGDEARLAHRDTLDTILGDHLSQQPADHWIGILIENDIPCSVIETVATIAESPIARDYRAFSEVETGDGNTMRFVRNPLAVKDASEPPAPCLGQHTAEILAELGLDAAEIGRLAG